MSDLARLFDAQRAAFARERYPSLAVRRDRLARLKNLLTRHESRFVAAVDRDFGGRSSHETRLAELYVVAAEIADAHSHLARWMRPQRVATPIHLKPARARIERQPVGVVGVISPWNYPVQLALSPVIAALAAGNRALLKPSELTPNTSTLLAELVSAHFREDEFAVVEGDAQVGQAFASLPFDHLLFTGSTAVGRRVAIAAAANLTPVTLELGGKSPAVFDRDAELASAVPRLLVGKLLNAGQTCIAPDYALVPASRLDEFVATATGSVAALYPEPMANPDYSSIVDARHYARLNAMVDDARSKGARIVTLGNVAAPDARYPRRMPPTLLLDVTDDMAVMREEIFGPLLPVETYATLDDAIARINRRPHPLALYWFGRNAGHRERVLRETLAGGVTVNDTLLHILQDSLPFGGVGASGMGHYHGRWGFETFSKLKPVFRQSRVNGMALFLPPYRPAMRRMLRLMKKV